MPASARNRVWALAVCLSLVISIVLPTRSFAAQGTDLLATPAAGDTLLNADVTANVNVTVGQDEPQAPPAQEPAATGPETATTGDGALVSAGVVANANVTVGADDAQAPAADTSGASQEAAAPQTSVARHANMRPPWRRIP